MELEDERTPEARARAETALVRLIHEVGDAPVVLTVLGGLVPAVLAEGLESAPPHVGTADVDLLLITHVEKTEGLALVEDAMRRMGFAAVDDEGWRWRGIVDRHAIKIEFLCDLPGYREGEAVRPPECKRLAACNLRGTGYVDLDSHVHQITASLANGTLVEVSVRFAGLGGYLLSKVVAVRTRAATKDYYDFIYVLIHNPSGGPVDAARLLLDGRFDDALRNLSSTLNEVRQRFRNTMDFGPQQYADQAEQANPGQDPALLRADAVSAASGFFQTLLDQ